MKEKDLGICVLWIMPVKFQGIWSALCRTCYGLFGGRVILIIWLAIFPHFANSFFSPLNLCFHELQLQARLVESSLYSIANGNTNTRLCWDCRSADWNKHSREYIYAIDKMETTSVVQLFEFIKNQWFWYFNYFSIKEPPVPVISKTIRNWWVSGHVSGKNQQWTGSFVFKKLGTVAIHQDQAILNPKNLPDSVSNICQTSETTKSIGCGILEI